MHKMIRVAILTATLAASALAGPTLACHEWVSTPGSVFETLDPLRKAVYAADDSPVQGQAARARLVELKAAIKPNDAVSLLKAGYWAALLHDVRVDDVDGRQMILQALALRPNDPEYQFIAALAFVDRDKATFQKHWARARELAKPGTAVAKNLELFEKVLAARQD